MIHLDVAIQPSEIAAYTRKSRKALDKTTKVTHFEQEMEKARLFFNDPANYDDDKKLTDKSFTFGVYKAKSVSDALVEAYGLKCAYCESDFAAVTPKDVEHFRPKNEIDPGDGSDAMKPGYWWLAGVWSNLLVSCADCNRQRNHEVPGAHGPEKIGKGTLFPIAPGVHHARTEGGEPVEEPGRLLLHPVLDEPMDHLTFGDDALIHPVDVGGQLDPRGEASIRVYALQRGELVKRRLVVLNSMKEKIEQLVRQIKIHNDVIGTPSEPTSIEQIRSLRGSIAGLLAPGMQYLGMLREHIRREKAAGHFAILEQFQIDLEALI